MAEEHLEFPTPTLTPRPQVGADAGDEGYAKSLAPLYVLNWSTTGMADSTAVALYMHYWGAFNAVPQWLLALCSLVVVLTINLVSVRLFGEIEFWFALIKVAAIMSFLLIGVWLLGSGHPVGGTRPGLGLFYVCSVLMLVTVQSKIGVPGIMNARHVPYGGILFTCAFATLGVGLNAWLPGEAFDIVVNFAALGVVTTWIMIMLCHLLFVRRTRESAGPNRLVRPGFWLKGWPWVDLDGAR